MSEKGGRKKNIFYMRTVELILIRNVTLTTECSIPDKLTGARACTYISVMFSMSSNVRTGKSSIPGSESIQTILEMLQVQDSGQAPPNLHISPVKSKNNPERAMPCSPALESIAGPTIIPSRTESGQIGKVSSLRYLGQVNPFFPPQVEKKIAPNA